jgi:hypothetical protein
MPAETTANATTSNPATTPPMIIPLLRFTAMVCKPPEKYLH